MAVKLYQSLVNQVKDIVNEEFGIMDDTGLILACSNEKVIGQNNALALEVMRSKDQFVVIDGQSFLKVYIKSKLEFITFINSQDKENYKYLSLISVNAINMKTYYEEKYDKLNFIKGIIMDNILPGDITLRAKELHLANNVKRVVFLINTEKAKDIYTHEIIEGLFPGKNKDFVIILDDESTVLVKEIKQEFDYKEITKTSRIIIDTLSSELVKAKVGVGTVVDNIKDIGRSYKEAEMALLIGGIFDDDQPVNDYNRLGIGRLIYQLPTTSCTLFLNEVFKDGSFESLDSETMSTIQKFFENNLNVSETSRQLYIHRNTLVYRLDKIQKITGLDLRMFDDAIIFKVAMLVKKYLDSNKRFM
ncbi:helix-turn-helix domain-containing protein [Acetivibrio cellulolyticus]|uniref:helix-turn-helix domain-containing protein n=1 Tax=Acetivibrio cellulolyticus TaxID=35830 RepID=UPI0001E2D533|nr:helix-turn-helix domain-containing protein [Acetivibrio cellulolyticus]